MIITIACSQDVNEAISTIALLYCLVHSA